MVHFIVIRCFFLFFMFFRCQQLLSLNENMSQKLNAAKIVRERY
jgi:uncharacterized membrane protein